MFATFSSQVDLYALFIAIISDQKSDEGVNVRSEASVQRQEFGRNLVNDSTGRPRAIIRHSSGFLRP